MARGSTLDAFWLAVATLALSALAWAAAGSGAGFALFALACAGLVVGSRLPISREGLAWLALLLIVVMWLALLGLLGGNRSTSTIAHGSASAALALVLAEPLSHHWKGKPGRGAMFLGLVGIVFAAGVVWEVAEWSTDALFGSELAKSLRDSLLDLVADAAGAMVGAAVAVRRRYR
jgi:hypothetical protein